jgi:protein Tex
VTVVEVDIPRKRIALTMRKGSSGPPTGRKTGGVPTTHRIGTTPTATAPHKPAAPAEGWFSAALKNAQTKKDRP